MRLFINRPQLTRADYRKHLDGEKRLSAGKIERVIGLAGPYRSLVWPAEARSERESARDAQGGPTIAAVVDACARGEIELEPIDPERSRDFHRCKGACK
jgi:hypothetical protein